MFHFRSPFRCIRNCAAKVNPATKMTLKEEGQSSGKKKILYNWKIQEYEENKCKDVKENVDKFRVDMTQEFLIIPAGFFQGGGKEQERSQGAPVAQLVEHRAVTREVVSSTSAGPTLRVFK